MGSLGYLPWNNENQVSAPSVLDGVVWCGIEENIDKITTNLLWHSEWCQTSASAFQPCELYLVKYQKKLTSLSWFEELLALINFKVSILEWSIDQSTLWYMRMRQTHWLWGVLLTVKSIDKHLCPWKKSKIQLC